MRPTEVLIHLDLHWTVVVIVDIRTRVTIQHLTIAIHMSGHLRNRARAAKATNEKFQALSILSDVVFLHHVKPQDHREDKSDKKWNQKHNIPKKHAQDSDDHVQDDVGSYETVELCIISFVRYLSQDPPTKNNAQTATTGPQIVWPIAYIIAPAPMRRSWVRLSYRGDCTLSASRNIPSL